MAKNFVLIAQGPIWQHMVISTALGLALAVLTIAVHAFGTTALVGAMLRRENNFKGTSSELWAYSMASGSLLLLHIAETLIWAVAYMFFVGGGQLDSFEDAVYFSTVTFTTLGYGDIVIEGRWKMLSACQAMSGLLVFGWSTALLFAIVQRVWSKKADLASDQSEDA